MEKMRGTETYLKPEMEIVRLEKNDVIITSILVDPGVIQQGPDVED